MRKEFLEYLVSSGALPRTSMETVERHLRPAPQPIGSIAFNYGLLRCEDIDAILAEQRCKHEPFGEIAIRFGVLTRDQLESLLYIQQVRAASEVAEVLALAGLCPTGAVMEKLGAFLAQAIEAPACASA